MNHPEQGFRCPRCGQSNFPPVEPVRSFACLGCRTAVVLIDEIFWYHASLGGTDAPVRGLIKRITPEE